MTSQSQHSRLTRSGEMRFSVGTPTRCDSSARAEYRPITDTEAMDAFRLLCRTEGIIPAIESAHGLAGTLKLGAEIGSGAIIVVNLSGRGDKDVETAAKWFGLLDPKS